VSELNARYDEGRNLHWSRELERAGAHVVHDRTTARTYEDLGLLTADPAFDARGPHAFPLPHRLLAGAVVLIASRRAHAHALCAKSVVTFGM
jgi:Polyphosphate kinase C-terminal domain 1